MLRGPCIVRWSALGLALVLTGCMSFSVQTRFGHLEQTTFDATSAYDALTGVARVDVGGAIRASGTENVRVEMYVVDRACSMGPEGDPEAYIARKTQRLGDPASGRNETRSYLATFEVRMSPGREFAAIAIPHADNTIGPIFGACETLRAIP